MKNKKLIIPKKPDLVATLPTDNTYQGLSQSELLARVKLLHEQIVKINKYLMDQHRATIYNWDADDKDSLILELPETQRGLLLDSTIKIRGGWDPTTNTPALTAVDKLRIGWLYIVNNTSTEQVFGLNWHKGNYAIYDTDGNIKNITAEMLDNFNSSINLDLINGAVSNHNNDAEAHQDLFETKMNKLNTPHEAGKILVSTGNNNNIGISEVSIAGVDASLDNSATTMPNNKMITEFIESNVTGEGGAIKSGLSTLRTNIELDIVERINLLKAEADNKYTTRAESAAAYVHEGTYNTYAELVANAEKRVGAVCNVREAYEDNPAGTGYTWNATRQEWEPLGGIVSLANYITKTETIRTIQDITTLAYSYADGLIEPLNTDYNTFKNTTINKISLVESDLASKQSKLTPTGYLEIDSNNNIKVNIDMDNYDTREEVTSKATNIANVEVTEKIGAVVVPLQNEFQAFKNSTNIGINDVNANLNTLNLNLTNKIDNLDGAIQVRENNLETRVIGTIDSKIIFAKNDIADIYAKKADIPSAAFKPKGSFETYALLESLGEKQEGYIYTVNTAHGVSPAFTNYLWNASKGVWEPFGGIIDLSHLPTRTEVTGLLEGITETTHQYADLIAEQKAAEALDGVTDIVLERLTDEVERLDTNITNNYNNLSERVNGVNNATVTYIWENTYKKDETDDLVLMLEEAVDASNTKADTIRDELINFKTLSEQRLELVEARPVLEGEGNISIVSGKIRVNLSEYDKATDAEQKMEGIAVTKATEIATNKANAVKSEITTTITNLDSTIQGREASLKTQLEDAITSNINITKSEIAGIYAKKVDATTIYTPKGSKDTYTQLVADGEQVYGYIYVVKAKHGSTPANSNYTWYPESNTWEPIGGLVDLSNYTTIDALNTRLAGFDEEYKGHADTVALAVENKLTEYKNTLATRLDGFDAEFLARPKITGAGNISVNAAGVVSVNLSDYDTKTVADGKMASVAETKANAVAALLNDYKTANNTAVNNLNTRVNNIPILEAGVGIAIENGKIKSTIDIGQYAKTTDVETIAENKATAAVASQTADIVEAQITNKLLSINSKVVTLETFKTTTEGTLNELAVRVEDIPVFDETDFEIDPETKKVRARVTVANTYTKTESNNKFLSKTEAGNIYLKKLDQGVVYRPQGSVADMAALNNIPIAERNLGDVYNVIAADPATNTPAGANFAWVYSQEAGGTVWDSIGGMFDISKLALKADTFTKTEVTNAINTKATNTLNTANQNAYAYTDQKIAALPAGGSGGGSSLTPKITQTSTSGLLVLDPNKHYYLTAQDGDFMIQLNTDGEVSGSDNEYMLDVYFKEDGLLGVAFDFSEMFVATNAPLDVRFVPTPGLYFLARTRLSLSIIGDTITLYKWEYLQI